MGGREMPIPFERAVPFLAATGRARAIARRFVALFREHWREGIVFSALFFVSMGLRFGSLIWDAGAQREMVENMLVKAPLMFGAVLFVAALDLRPVWRLLATLPAVTAAIFAGIAIVAIARGDIYAETLVKLQLVESDAAVRAADVWTHVGFAMVLAWYLTIREKEAAIAGAARAAQLERARTQRAVVESRLKVMQARVEPELLFSVLADVRRRYVVDRSDGDALLDDLIAYLRVALPQMREGASTLGREAALAQAYLRIVPAGRDGRLVVRVRIPTELAKLPFPPMVLLPLVHAASEITATEIVMAASALPSEARDARGHMLAITVNTTLAPAGWRDDRLTGLRETLANAFGEPATLDIRRMGQATTAEVRWAGTPEPIDDAG